MIVCPRCAKENQDHYKFCLGCGAELPKDAAQAPKSFSVPTPPSGFQSPFAAQPVPAKTPAAVAPAAPAAPVAATPAAPAELSPPAPAAAPGPLKCPQCGTQVPPGFKFCGSCGFNMQGVAPSTPAPASPPAVAPGPVAAPPSAAAPAPIAAPSAPKTAPRGTLTLVRPDGSEGDTFPLGDTTIIGREAGALFAGDSYLSPKHASFVFKDGQLTVSDVGSLNGIYVRIAREQPVELESGSIFRIGQEILRFEPIAAPAKGADGVEAIGSPNPGYIGRIVLVIGRDTGGNAFPIPSTGMHLGRERGDVIFPEDGYVSGLHCRIHAEGGRILLTDVGSSNGTFLRVRTDKTLQKGDTLLMGQQLFRVQF